MQMDPLTQEDMERLLYPILSETIACHSRRDRRGRLRVTSSARTNGRFRVNLFKQRGRLSLVARRVSSAVPTFSKLGLPAFLSKSSCHYDQGMVILAGVTGSGKKHDDRLPCSITSTNASACIF